MAKSRDPKPKGRPPLDPVEKKDRHVSARLDKLTESAFDAYVAAQDIEPDQSAILRKAIHEFLEKRGYWPPKSSS